MRKVLGRELPDRVEGFGDLCPYYGETNVACPPGGGAIRLSFHHHLRNGDHVTRMVLQEAILQTRGGRARAIEAGELPIDVIHATC